MNDERRLANGWATKLHLKTYEILYEFMRIFLCHIHFFERNNESIFFFFTRFQTNIAKHKIKIMFGLK